MKSLNEFNLGQRIRKARKDAGLSQIEIAETTKVGQSTIGRWELNQGKGPSSNQLAAIAKATGKSISFFTSEKLPLNDQTHDDLLRLLREKNNKLDNLKSQVLELQSQLNASKIEVNKLKSDILNLKNHEGLIKDLKQKLNDLKKGKGAYFSEDEYAVLKDDNQFILDTIEIKDIIVMMMTGGLELQNKIRKLVNLPIKSQKMIDEIKSVDVTERKKIFKNSK